MLKISDITISYTGEAHKSGTESKHMKKFIGKFQKEIALKKKNEQERIYWNGSTWECILSPTLATRQRDANCSYTVLYMYTWTSKTISQT